MTAQNLSENATRSDFPKTEQQIMSEAELKKILFEFNQTLRDYPADKYIHQLFEEQVERTPNAIAVVFEQQELTYEALNQKANQLAHYLRMLGVKPEVLVGLCVERSIDMVIGMLGILKAGGAYVPLDPNYPVERIEYMVNDAVLSVVVTEHHLVNLLPHSSAKVVCVDSDSSMWSGETHSNPLW